MLESDDIIFPHTVRKNRENQYFRPNFTISKNNIMSKYYAHNSSKISDEFIKNPSFRNYLKIENEILKNGNHYHLEYLIKKINNKNEINFLKRYYVRINLEKFIINTIKNDRFEFFKFNESKNYFNFISILIKNEDSLNFKNVKSVLKNKDTKAVEEIHLIYEIKNSEYLFKLDYFDFNKLCPFFIILILFKKIKYVQNFTIKSINENQYIELLNDLFNQESVFNAFCYHYYFNKSEYIYDNYKSKNKKECTLPEYVAIHCQSESIYSFILVCNFIDNNNPQSFPDYRKFFCKYLISNIDNPHKSYDIIRIAIPVIKKMDFNNEFLDSILYKIDHIIEDKNAIKDTNQINAFIELIKSKKKKINKTQLPIKKKNIDTIKKEFISF